jgi:NADH-quinone oxidoreductase subunit J
MTSAFYISAAVAILATLMVVTRRSAMHALLYLIVSLLAVAVVFFTLGAPFVAALEVIIYAGAIMVLFIFVIMMLNPGSQADSERHISSPWAWAGPSALSAVLLFELVAVIERYTKPGGVMEQVTPKDVGLSLFGPYLVGVELASLLLLAALVGVYHLGVKRPASPGKGDE